MVKNHPGLVTGWFGGMMNSDDGIRAGVDLFDLFK